MDPAEKYFGKTAHMKFYLNEISNEIEVSRKQELLFTGRATNQKILQLENEKTRVLQLLQRHSARVLDRQGENFTTFFTELNSLENHFISTAKIQSLIQDISNLLNYPSRLHSVIAAEVLWQESTQKSAKNILKYSQFDDIVQVNRFSIFPLIPKRARLVASTTSNTAFVNCFSQCFLNYLSTISSRTNLILLKVLEGDKSSQWLR